MNGSLPAAYSIGGALNHIEVSPPTNQCSKVPLGDDIFYSCFPSGFSWNKFGPLLWWSEP